MSKLSKYNLFNSQICKILLIVIVISAAILSIIAANTRIVLDMAERHGTMIHAMAKIQSESIGFRLQLEKSLSGDSTFREVEKSPHLQTSKQLVNALLIGGNISGVKIKATNSTKLKQRLRKISNMLLLLESMAQNYLEDTTQNNTGKFSNTRITSAFNQLQMDISDAELTLQFIISTHKSDYVIYSYILSALMLVAIIMTAYKFFRFEKLQLIRIARMKYSAHLLSESQKIASLGHWDWDIIKNKIEWSDEHYRICGLEPNEVTPNYEIFVNFVHPTDREKWKQMIAAAMANKIFELEHRLLLNNGDIRCVQTTGKVYYDSKNQPIRMLGTIQDITGQKAIELDAENSRKKFEAIIKSIPDAIVYATPNRKIEMINSSTLDLFGYEADELYGQTTKMLCSTVDNFINIEKYRFSTDLKNDALPYDSIYKRKNGEEFQGETLGTSVLSSDGNIIGYLGIIRDVTKRNQVDSILKFLAEGNSSLDFESTINESLSRLADVYNCRYAFISILENNGKNATTLAVIDSGERIENFSYALKGDPCETILQRKKLFISDKASESFQNSFMLQNWDIEGFFGTRLSSQDGKAIGIIAVMDTKAITLDQWTEPVLDVFATHASLEIERSKASQELSRHREHLEQQVRERTREMQFARDESDKANLAKSEFLSRMSHELRTPMNAILGFAQLLQLDKNQLTELQSDNLDEISKAGHHLLTLINEVLDLAKIESGKLDISLGSVSVGDIVNQGISLITPLATARNIEITNQIEGNDYDLHADPTRLLQILINLLSNAVKYNKENGKITLDYQIISNNQLRILVTDTGIGLSEKDIDMLFAPFERQVSSQYIEGTGIGLVITKSLIELMGGCIGVESKAGTGSTFWIQLNLHQQLNKRQA